MAKRKTYLTIGLVCVIVAYVGQGLVSRSLFQPLRERRQRVAALEDELSRQEIRQQQIRRASRQLERWERQSLPADVSAASTLYQNWLLKAAQQTGLQHAVVTPNRAVPQEGVSCRIPFTIQAEARLGNLCDFLYAFSQRPLLHKIKEINIDSDGAVNNPDLHVTLHLEALALATALGRTELPEPSAVSAGGSRLRYECREDYQPIAQRNLFVRGDPVHAPRRSQPPASVSRPDRDPIQAIYHVGTVVQNDRREAWLYDRVRKRDFVLVEGAPFEVAGLSGMVQTVGNDFVLLSIDGRPRRLEFSQNLRQLQTLP